LRLCCPKFIQGFLQPAVKNKGQTVFYTYAFNASIVVNMDPKKAYAF
jgi:hypothetical protein